MLFKRTEASTLFELEAQHLLDKRGLFNNCLPSSDLWQNRYSAGYFDNPEPNQKNRRPYPRPFLSTEIAFKFGKARF